MIMLQLLHDTLIAISVMCHVMNCLVTRVMKIPMRGNLANMTQALGGS